VRSLGKDFIEGRDKIIAAEEQSWRRTHANIATMPGNRRLTQPPVKPRPATDLHALPASPVPAAPARQRDRKMIVTMLGAFVLLLGVGVVFAMKSGGHKPAPAANHSPPETEAVMPTTPATTTAEPTRAATPEPAEPTPAAASDVAAPEPEPVVATPEPEPVADKPPVKHAPPAKKPKPATRPVAVKQDKKKEEPPPPNPIKQAIPEAKPAAAEKPKDDCNPPYYFEGQKKVFKTNCL
jgi:hypothetical protein